MFCSSGLSMLPVRLTPTFSLQVLDRNPEFGQMLNNPDMLRESMRLAANPVSISSETCPCGTTLFLDIQSCGDVNLTL